MNTIKLPYSEIEAEIEATPMIMPDSVIEITENGIYDVARYSYADVNVEGTAGETSVTIFSDDVTTESDPALGNAGLLNITPIIADSIEVVFDDVTYVCERQIDEENNIISYGAPIGETGIDFSDIPFLIGVFQGDLMIVTENAGTYSVIIKAPIEANTTETVTGTLSDPWSTIPYVLLMVALETKQASAYLDIDATSLGAGHVISRPSATDHIYTNGGSIAGSTVSAFVIAWEDTSSLYAAEMYMGGNVVDISSYADTLTTSLEVVWHPVYEEVITS